MNILDFIATYYKYIISAAISAVFLVVNIIQFVRTKDKNKLNEAICRIPEIIRIVEQISPNFSYPLENDSTTTTIATKSIQKKATAESILISEFGSRFFKKYKTVFDDVIEDILNTPQKKGGSCDGISKKDEEKKR